MRFWKRCYIVVARVVLMLIEGPSKPWWAPHFMFYCGIAMFVATVGSRELRAVAGFGALCAFCGAVWYIVRRWQINAVVAIARQPLTHCPFCKYSLEGVTEDKCSECGRKPGAETERLREIMGINATDRKT